MLSLVLLLGLLTGHCWANECQDAPASNHCVFPRSWKINGQVADQCTRANNGPPILDAGFEQDDPCSAALAKTPCTQYVGSLKCSEACMDCKDDKALAPCKEDYMDVQEHCPEVFDHCFATIYQYMKNIVRECGSNRVRWGGPTE
mmetsp:Transcript_13436/g.42339  ORF Transcript_13436/g.42339 Transcript_13436/m.42339 type:complete len:145 (-) Transcript_13436:244-678(-)